MKIVEGLKGVKRLVNYGRAQEFQEFKTLQVIHTFQALLAFFTVCSALGVAVLLLLQVFLMIIFCHNLIFS